MNRVKKENLTAEEKALGTSINVSAAVLQGLNDVGVDGQALLEGCGLSQELLNDPNKRMPVALMQNAWKAAEQSVEDPYGLAVEIVKYFNASSLQALSFGLYSSATLREYFHRHAEFVEMMSASISLNLMSSRDSFTVTVGDHRTVKSCLGYLIFILYLCKNMRELHGPFFVIKRIEAPWAEDPWVKKRNGVLFDVAGNSPDLGLSTDVKLIFSAEQADAPLISANTSLASMHDQLCRDYLKTLDTTANLPRKVKYYIMGSLKEKPATLTGIAETMNMSARSLQRKLEGQGTSFANLLEAARKELAHEYARNDSLPSTEIAYLLGYSGPSQFATAFQKWYGCSLREFRRTKLSVA